MNEDLPVTQADFDELGDHVYTQLRLERVRATLIDHVVREFAREIEAYSGGAS